MSFVGKWFGFGKDAAFDDGVRAYEKKDFTLAAEHFLKSSTDAQESAVRERAKSYLAGAIGKLAADAIAKRDFETALNLYKQGVELRPAFADLLHGLARTQFLLGELPEATATIQKALDLNPNYAAAILLQGLIAYREERLDQGLQLINRAVEIQPTLDGEPYRRGLEFHEHHDPQRALEFFKEMKPAPSQVHDLIFQGNVAGKSGDWARAEESFRFAIELAPQYADLHVLRGQALMELGRLEEAEESFETSLKLNPNYAEAYALLGIVYRRQDEEEKARAAFRKALDIDPQHPIASQELIYRRPL